MVEGVDDTFILAGLDSPHPLPAILSQNRAGEREEARSVVSLEVVEKNYPHPPPPRFSTLSRLSLRKYRSIFKAKIKTALSYFFLN